MCFPVFCFPVQTLSLNFLVVWALACSMILVFLTPCNPVYFQSLFIAFNKPHYVALQVFVPQVMTVWLNSMTRPGAAWPLLWFVKKQQLGRSWGDCGLPYPVQCPAWLGHTMAGFPDCGSGWERGPSAWAATHEIRCWGGGRDVGPTWMSLYSPESPPTRTQSRGTEKEVESTTAKVFPRFALQCTSAGLSPTFHGSASQRPAALYLPVRWSCSACQLSVVWSCSACRLPTARCGSNRRLATAPPAISRCRTKKRGKRVVSVAGVLRAKPRVSHHRASRVLPRRSQHPSWVSWS